MNAEFYHKNRLPIFIKKIGAFKNRHQFFLGAYFYHIIWTPIHQNKIKKVGCRILSKKSATDYHHKYRMPNFITEFGCRFLSKNSAAGFYHKMFCIFFPDQVKPTLAPASLKNNRTYCSPASLFSCRYSSAFVRLFDNPVESFHDLPSPLPCTAY